MGGGLMQLVAYGAQDVYLTGNPQITFWKVTYRRHTNFSLESIEQTFNGQADFGRRVTCTISRNGDLAYRTYLQVTLPEINQDMHNPRAFPNNNGVNNSPNPHFGSNPDPTSLIPYHINDAVYARWLDCPGEQLISQVEVEIGGQRIDRQYGDWMHIWQQLTLSAEQERGYNKMIGNTTQLTFITDPTFANVEGPCDSNTPDAVCAPRNALPETTLYVPLQFWYCRNPGLALPLIALQYHEVKINLDLRPIDECLWAVQTLNCGGCPPGTMQSANGLCQNVLTNGSGFDGELSPSGDFVGSGSAQKNIVPSPYRPGMNVKVVTAYNQSLVAASLYVDYVFLDTDERRRMAQNPHEYLIEQLQFTGDESVGSSSNKLKLNFNHPCKELIWVVQPDCNVDYCSSLECGTNLFSALGAQPFNYTDALDALPNGIMAFGGPTAVADGMNTQWGSHWSFIGPDGLFAQTGAEDTYAQGGDLQKWNVLNSLRDSGTGSYGAYGSAAGGGKGGSDGEYYHPGVVGGNPLDAPNGGLQPKTNAQYEDDLASGGFYNGGAQRVKPARGNVDLTSFQAQQNPSSTVSDAGTFVLNETSLMMHCWGENPVVTAKLQLNGQDRFSEREGTYFDLVQPFQHHTRSPDTGINVYSFSLRPEEHQPSGSCNFSRIDNATLQLVLSNNTVEGTKTAKVRVYATNYNVLRIMSGMGGLAYSN